MFKDTTLLAGLFLFGLTSLYLWSLAIRRLRRDLPLLPFEPRPPVPWGLLAPLLFVGLFMSEAISVVVILGTEQMDLGMENQSADQLSAMLLVSSTTKLLYLIAVIVWLIRIGGATWKDLGWDVCHGWSDLVTGVCGFFMLVAVVFSIQAVLSFVFEYEHPILDLLEADETGHFFATAFFSAVVVAPLTEEFFFRVILQSWFENLAEKWKKWSESRDALTEPLPADGVTTTIEFDPQAETVAEAETDVIRCGAWWPIFASALPFAAMHIGQGPAPIPLFVLAIGLGYIYQRTHRILPCIVVHSLLNGTSLLAFLAGGGAG